jgi:argininosuccinate synthase
MIPLHKFLIPRLYLVQGGGCVKIEQFQCLQLRAGEVTLRLYKGNLDPVSRKSPYSLYSLDIASFTMGAEYDQKDAAGFIRILGLPSRSRARSRVEVG